MTRFLWLGLLFFFGFAMAAEAGCRSLPVDANVFTACEFDPSRSAIELYNLDAAGQPLGGFYGLSQMVESRGKKLVFAMNAGMFGEDLKPIGLYVEAGQQIRKLNRRGGYGNFHLKPNGVFYISDGRAQVMESEAYAKANLRPDYATQSGPMLVINGAYHPRISASGTSEKIRNGVGVRTDGTVVFVISDTLVSFHEFASVFRDSLNCPDALFLDGSVSSLYSAELGRNDGLAPLGPMVAVTETR
jgi:uncharacterized protein YigE (DUF2233 family)